MSFYDKYKRRLTKTDVENLTADSKARKLIAPKGEQKYEIDYETPHSQKRKLKGHFDSRGALHLLAEGVRKRKVTE